MFMFIQIYVHNKFVSVLYMTIYFGINHAHICMADPKTIFVFYVDRYEACKSAYAWYITCFHLAILSGLALQLPPVSEVRTCALHCATGTAQYLTAMTTVALPNVTISLRVFAPQVHTLLQGHNGSLPLIRYNGGQWQPATHKVQRQPATHKVQRQPATHKVQRQPATHQSTTPAYHS